MKLKKKKGNITETSEKENEKNNISLSKSSDGQEAFCELILLSTPSNSSQSNMVTSQILNYTDINCR